MNATDIDIYPNTSSWAHPKCKRFLHPGDSVWPPEKSENLESFQIYERFCCHFSSEDGHFKLDMISAKQKILEKKIF